MNCKNTIFAWCGVLLLASPSLSMAKSGLTIAVAANFAPAMEEISRLFTEKTAVPVRVTVSSSGRLYAQIRNGAPFDLFFSADTKRPELLFQENLCERPKEYVHGQAVLWSRDPAFCEKAGTWQKAVSGAGLKKIGIANPELAPYGAAAKEAFAADNLWYSAEQRMVFGSNVGQSFQYAATGAAVASFIALSLVHTEIGEKGCFLPMPEAEPVSQGCCLIRSAKNRKQAEQFMDFLASDETAGILEQYGYIRPTAQSLNP